MQKRDQKIKAGQKAKGPAKPETKTMISPVTIVKPKLPSSAYMFFSSIMNPKLRE
jgi:hypothetical protein